ncbi:MAG: hypothetical protein OHK93_003161 [Ramalina farinacea]|uniref:Uncharacterized protein n=1 Tax=Ramalina farinacea TaxID=258253 RepID=A0AA43QSV9_9LECA|nr:hypothetical protein [Ramalina farinacea]
MKLCSGSVWLLCSLCVNAVLAYPTNLTSNDTTAHYRRPAFQTCIGPSTEWWPTSLPTAEVLASDCENALFQMVDLQETYGDGVSSLEPPNPLDARSVVNRIADQTQLGSFVYQGTNSYATFLNKEHGSGFPIRFALPALFSHGSCTIAVMMMRMWKPHGEKYRFPQLPYVFDRDWSTKEEAEWTEITSIVGEIRSTCKGGMGYAIFGPSSGLGVALWRKGNLWERAVEGYASTGTNSTVEADEASEVVAIAK